MLQSLRDRPEVPRESAAAHSTACPYRFPWRKERAFFARSAPWDFRFAFRSALPLVFPSVLLYGDFGSKSYLPQSRQGAKKDFVTSRLCAFAGVTPSLNASDVPGAADSFGSLRV